MLAVRENHLYKKIFSREKGEKERERGWLRRGREREGQQECVFWISSTVHLDKKIHMNIGI